MGLYFKNNTNEKLWIAYSYESLGCEGGVNWAKKGWYDVSSGATVKVYTGWVSQRKFFYFAEADDLSPAWAGPFFTLLPWTNFDWCWTTGSTNSRNLGLRKLVIPWGYLDWTVNLTK